MENKKGCIIMNVNTLKIPSTIDQNIYCVHSVQQYARVSIDQVKLASDQNEFEALYNGLTKQQFIFFY